MATKVTILGEAQGAETKKAIEFIKLVCKETQCDTNVPPNQYKNIELICKNYTAGMDAMFAYDTIRDNGCLFFGYFNDGIV